MSTEKATLGGGCFWCLEAIYEQLRGVSAVQSGYAGGHVPNPTYEQVSTGTTGHAEVVQITYDPDTISYRDLLEIFFEIHDPTTPNRQGNDIGPQYRSIIFHHNDDQRRDAAAIVDELTAAGRFDAPIVTELEPLEEFYRAEEYHDAYFRRNPNQGYCRLVVAPKVAAFRRQFAAKLNS